MGAVKGITGKGHPYGNPMNRMGKNGFPKHLLKQLLSALPGDNKVTDNVDIIGTLADMLASRQKQQLKKKDSREEYNSTSDFAVEEDEIPPNALARAGK